MKESTDKMQVYLVGGAVRDTLLKHPFHERDWVVVGATPEQLLAQGYQQVGRDFPVFLHPQSKEEYALARTERKTGTGYTGFQVYASPEVTLEEDLARRDLTINAIAMDPQGQIIDPYQGQQDLADRVLRHVSPAFVEDPLRVLRIARFAARYHYLGFSIAAETRTLMAEISASGELQQLTPERVWKETERALKEASPAIYFQVLQECGALQALFPELAQLWGVPNPAKHHPEIDSGIHTLMVLTAAAQLTTEPEVRFAALLHDLGKGVTPAALWPKHHGHEQHGLPLIRALCERLRTPSHFRDLALLVGEFHGHAHKALELKPSTLLKLFNQQDLWRKPARFEQFLTACEADSKGRTGYETRPYPAADYLRQMAAAANTVQVKPIIDAGYQGKAIREQLEQQRIAAITQAKAEYMNSQSSE